MRKERADFEQLQSLRAARDAATDPDEKRKAQRAYERVRNQIATQNHGLVVRLAQRYGGNSSALEDLIQEGAIGMLQALETFDTSACPTHTNVAKQFCMFVVPYINGAILRARPRAEMGRLSIPEHAVRYAERLAVQDSKTWQAGDAAGVEEVVKPEHETGSEERPGRNHAPDTITALRAWKRNQLVSMDRTAADGRIPHETIAAPEPRDEVDEEALDARVRAVLSSLPPEYRRILCWRYGWSES